MPKEKLPDEKCVTLEDGSCIGEGCMHDPKTPPVRVWTRAELDAEISDRNARFNALTPAERRVAIMRDVQEQVRLGRIEPTKGCYLGFDSPDPPAYKPDLQRRVDRLTECKACARGSIFVSAAQMFDRLPPGRGTLHCHGDASYLIRDGTFTEEQLTLIEAAFEMSGGFTYAGEGGEEAAAWGRQFETAKERLLAIAQNVIDNGGEFIP